MKPNRQDQKKEHQNLGLMGRLVAAVETFVAWILAGGDTAKLDKIGQTLDGIIAKIDAVTSKEK